MSKALEEESSSDCRPAERNRNMFAVYADHAAPDDPLSSLRIGEMPDPKPPADWVRVKISHASLNRPSPVTIQFFVFGINRRLRIHSRYGFPVLLPTTLITTRLRLCGIRTTPRMIQRI